MVKKTLKNPEDYIYPLNINGLEGRMLRLPPPEGKKREILFIYGQHSTLERWWGLMEEFNKYGALTMPDLPGFGGMTSLYKIGQEANLDNLAGYLAAFVKLKYRRKKVTIAGMSLAFAIVTRMLQLYPELTGNVEYLISIVGLAHHDDFIFNGRRKAVYRMGSAIFARKWPAFFFRHIFLQPAYLKRVYHRSSNAKEKFKDISGDEFQRTMETEILLWKVNDIRTQMKTSYEMLTLNNSTRRVDLPVYHVASKKDRYFNNVKVENHMRQIFSDFHIFYTKSPNHAPTIIADAKDAAPFIPPALRRLLAQDPK